MSVMLKIPAFWDVTLCGQLNVTGVITLQHLTVAVVAVEYINFNIRFYDFQLVLRNLTFTDTVTTTYTHRLLY
jgi:hypothetical protein